MGVTLARRKSLITITFAGSARMATICITTVTADV